MNPVASLIEKLREHPELVYRAQPGFLRIDAASPTGFSIEVRADEHGWSVWLGEAGFHDDFSRAEDLFNFVAWCFSGEARVREVWRGKKPQRSVLETFEDGQWREVSATVFIFVPWWRPRTEVILQNPNLLRRG